MSAYSGALAETANAKSALCADLPAPYEQALVRKLCTLQTSLMERTEVLEKALLDVKAISDLKQCAEFYSDTVIVAMNELRAVADELETLVSREYWPFPTYGDLLFGVV